MSDKLDLLDAEIQAWLLRCERAGITAIAIMLLDKAIVVRCQDATDVGPLCRRVAAEHDAPPDRTLQ